MVTQEQIARKLGDSRQLVTFAPAGHPQGSEKSRQRILAAAFDMGSNDVALGSDCERADFGLRVPDIVALVGCDGIQDTEYLECPLTTIVQPVAEKRATAWEFLVKRLKPPAAKRQEGTLKASRAIRESSGRTPVGRETN